MMKKLRLSRILAFVLLAASILFLSRFYGNPISKAIERRQIERYLAGHFAERRDLAIVQMRYNWIVGSYEADIQSQRSPDTAFSIRRYDSRWTDDYAQRVQEKENTASRLSQMMTRRLAEEIKASGLSAELQAELIREDRSKLTLDMSEIPHSLAFKITLRHFVDRADADSAAGLATKLYQIVSEEKYRIDSLELFLKTPTQHYQVLGIRREHLAETVSLIRAAEAYWDNHQAIPAGGLAVRKEKRQSYD